MANRIASQPHEVSARLTRIMGSITYKDWGYALWLAGDGLHRLRVGPERKPGLPKLPATPPMLVDPQWSTGRIVESVRDLIMSFDPDPDPGAFLLDGEPYTPGGRLSGPPRDSQS